MPPDAGIEGLGCGVPTSFGDLGFVEGRAQGPFPSDSAVWRGQILLSDEELPWEYAIAYVRLDPGEGYFEDGKHTGTFAITGPETSPETCSMCVRVSTVIDRPTGYDVIRCYMATSGWVTLTSVEERLTGSLANATFSPISCASSDEIESDCSTAVEGLSFDDRIEPFPP